MGHRPFSQPVFLKLHHAGTFQARSAWEAHEYLDLHWSAARTAHYRQAKALCQSAVDGLVDAEMARRAVIDAAQRSAVRDWPTAQLLGPRRFSSVAKALHFAFEHAAPISLRGARLLVAGRVFAGDDLVRLNSLRIAPFTT